MEKLFKPHIEDYLREHNWVRIECGLCKKEFYSKELVELCGGYLCEKRYSFFSKPARKQYESLEELFSKTKNFFCDQHYDIVNSLPISHKKGSTLFVTSGVQILEQTISEETPLPEKPIFVVQPVIRTQFINDVGLMEGISTSFINISTEEINPTPRSYINNVDMWFDYLSNIGFFMRDITLSFREDSPNWGNGRFNNFIVDVNYKGLQLGDIVYSYNIPQKTRGTISFCDIGFGLERLCWALNKPSSYFDVIGPITLSKKKNLKEMDLLRSMVLMVGGGVVPSNKNQGYHLRKFAKRYLKEKGRINMDTYFDYYYSFWNKFNLFEVDKKRAKEILRKELIRNYNIFLLEKLGLDYNKTSLDISTEELISCLLKKGIKFDEIVGSLALDNL